MKKLFLLLLVAIIHSQFSCNNIDTNKNATGTKENTINAEITDSVSDKIFTTDWKTLTKDFATWYNYTYYNVRLSQDFVGLDIDSINIDKKACLKQLMRGNVVAFKIKILQGEPVYKLFKLNSSDESIRATIKQMASAEMTHYKMEGIEIPDFRFTDLNGKVYNKSSINGKTVVLKCWFTHCVACVKEFPELDKLVDENQGRNDILYISLAMDSKQNLLKFLETKEFKYAVVPETKNYMVDKLKVTEFPTHLLIDRNGKIIKVVNRIEDLVPFVKKELGKGHSKQESTIEWSAEFDVLPEKEAEAKAPLGELYTMGIRGIENYTNSRN